MGEYIELIFNLIQTKGYARVTDLAETLEEHPSSVTKMVQKLERDEYVHYENYLGFDLQDKETIVGIRDLAETIEVHPTSVTKMVQKLDRDEYVNYEKYRGFVLTDKGTKVGKRLLFRHELLEEFLEIIGVETDRIYDDVEGIEHHLSWNAIDRIADLVQYF